MWQKFLNISLMWGTVRQLRMILPKSYRWRITLDFQMPISPNTFHVLLTEFASMAWSSASESTVLADMNLPDRRYNGNAHKISWIILLISWDQINLHLLHNRRFCSIVQRYGPNWTRISFNLTTLHVHQYDFQIGYNMKQCESVSAPTTEILLLTEAYTSHGLHCFNHMLYSSQTRTYENFAKLLTHACLEW